MSSGKLIWVATMTLAMAFAGSAYAGGSHNDHHGGNNSKSYGGNYGNYGNSHNGNSSATAIAIGGSVSNSGNAVAISTNIQNF